MKTGIEVELIAAPILSFAMEQSGVPLIRSLLIHNHGPEKLEAAELRLQLAPGLGDVQREAVPEILPGESAELGMIEYLLPAGRLRQVTEAERARLQWSIHARGKELARGETDVQVLAFNHWPGMRAPPALLASFVTPNHAVIAQLLRRTAEKLGGSLDGYQTRDPERVRAQVAALYEVVQSLGLAYAEVPASFEQTGQKIRLPDQLLAEQLGCCLDLSVLFASCLEQMGLAPLVVLVKGHAFPAVWLVDDRFPEGLVEDAARLRNQLALEQIIAFEATAAVSGRSSSFARAVDAARAHFSDDARFLFGIDVRACRSEFRPLPLRTVDVALAADEPAPTAQRTEIIRILRTASTDVPTEEPPPQIPDDVAARFRRWKDRLLDLTLRNKLLNFRPDAKGAIPLEVPDLPVFEDLLSSGHKFQVVGRPVARGEDGRDERMIRARAKDDAERARLVSDLARDVLNAPLPEDRLAKVARELVRDARTDIEEGGVSTLHAVVGVLKWIEPGTKKERLAPLVLYPVSITIDRARDRVTLTRLPDEDPVANVTLIEKLRRDAGVDLSFLADLATDEAGLDIAKLLKETRLAIQAKPGFEVLEEAHLARFSFAKFLMWKDLEDNAQVLLENPVVRHIAGASTSWQDIPNPMSPERLDSEVAANALPSVLDADSTQLSAVVSALRGRSFVLQGPPGTGKSQTITNLIAAALAEGKRVLFVSEKMAALEVVHRRLQQTGLGDFCLELHSHKTNKKDVLRSLGAALDRTAQAKAENWDSDSARVAALRTRLNAYAEALHRPRPSGFNVYSASARLRELKAAPEVRVQLPNAAELTVDQVGALKTAAAELTTRAQTVEPVSAHPWRLSARASWSAADEERLFDAIAEAAAALEQTEQAAQAVEAAVDFNAPRAIDALRQLASIAEAASNGTLPAAALEPSWPEQERKARAWLSDEARRKEDEASLLQRWTPELMQQELDPLVAKFVKWAGRFVLFAWLFLFSARKALKALSKSQPLPENTLVRDDLRLALLVRNESRRLEADRTGLAQLLDEGLLDRGAALHAAVLLPADARARLVQRSAGFAQERRSALKTQAAALKASVEALSAAEAKVRDLAGFAPGVAWPMSDDGGQFEALRTRLTSLVQARRSFRDWCLYREACAKLEALGHGAFVLAHASGAFKAAQLNQAVERNLLGRWLTAVVDREEVLRTFEVSGQERLVEEFADLDRKHLSLSREFVVAKLEERLPPPKFAEKEVSLLRRELQKKMRHIATRRLLQSTASLLPRLKSCFLMSPLSVAQYLPAGTRFDLVVFDEASQIGTHDAIGAIARGNQVVVVGDSRQLPPTAFFQRAAEDEEALPDENDVSELESVLEEAQAKGLPQQMLGWHYRSKHDALIAFSNRHYYDDRLFVFPAARQAVEDLGIKWHPVPEGVFLSGGDRTNPVEAERLVAHLVEQLKKFAPGTRSFGVVTFSLAQRTLIEDLLEAAIEKSPELEPHFAEDYPDAVFVKNLENVQGDERDEIYFSIGYAKDERGRMRMHFGPLSASGGERRLNVAITRARAQLRVFSTLRAEDIDLSRTRATGAAHLRSFLQFAARGAELREAAATNAFDSQFEREVFETLTKSGYRARTAVGCAGYRVDVAVERPDEPGVYAVGIQLDGPRWAGAKTARDRERLREQVLESLGWKMHRVWSTEWARDPEREAERMLQAVQAAVRRGPVSSSA